MPFTAAGQSRLLKYGIVPDNTMNNTSTLILSYTNPDLDTYGCALAYAELLNHQGYNATAGTFGTPIPEVQFILKYLQQIPLPECNPKDFNQVIVVDCSWPGNLDNRLDLTKVIEVIDHRQGTDPHDFPNATWNVELVGAAATLIGEKFQAAGAEPSQTAACFLMAGLISNSMNLQSSITCQRDHAMLDWLNQFAKLPSDFAKILFKAKSDIAGHNLYSQLYGDTTTPVPHGFSIAQLEMIGADEVITSRKQEVLATLDLIKAEQNLTAGAFAALIDIDQCATYFVTKDREIQDILSNVLHLRFNQHVAQIPYIILRKQYIPQLKATFQSIKTSTSAMAS